MRPRADWMAEEAGPTLTALGRTREEPGMLRARLSLVSAPWLPFPGAWRAGLRACRRRVTSQGAGRPEGPAGAREKKKKKKKTLLKIFQVCVSSFLLPLAAHSSIFPPFELGH